MPQDSRPSSVRMTFIGRYVRLQIEATGVSPKMPLKSNRRSKPGFSPDLYRHRNAIKRMFGRLEDFRRIGNNTTGVPMSSSQPSASQ